VEEYLSEKEQWEQIKRWLRENGLWIVAGVAVGAAVLSGLNWYHGHTDEVGSEASARYNRALDAFAKGDRTQAFVLLGELERDYSSSPYVDQVKLSAARAYVESGDLDKAAKELHDVSEHSKDPELALLAKLRLARVQIAQKKADEALTTLNGVQPGAFAPRYHEIRGDAFFAKGDKANALKEYLTAKAGDFDRSLDNQGLDLKISDLSAENPPAVAKQTPTPPTAAAK
jgi:predicted negative regulator of RcsB-dependent stress response